MAGLVWVVSSCDVTLIVRYVIQKLAGEVRFIDILCFASCVFSAYANAVLSSFCWHSQQENRMLAVTTASCVRDYTIFDRITLVGDLMF